MTTRPPSNDPADVAAWEEERARLREEKEFREDMRAAAADTKVRLEWLAQSGQAHDKRDEERFAEALARHDKLAKKVDSLDGQVTQTVNTNRHNWGVVAAWASAFVAIAGVGWALIEKLSGVLKP